MPIRSLEGVRIAAFTQFLLGPAGVQLLADLGADVIKVEAPRTGAWERYWSGAETFPGGVSAFFMLANRNVRSVTLNLKSDSGLEAARKLIESSEIVVENFRPGVMDRLGLSYESAKQLRPEIIYVSASGYGSTGPCRDLPGQDLLIQAVSGLASISGRAAEAPVPLGAAMVDQHGAALLAMATLAAVLHRDRTGEGQRVEVVMLDAAFDLATEPFVYHLNGAQLERPRSWITDTFHAAPYGTYPTSDGAVAISMSPVAQVRRALGGPPELEPFEDPSVAFERRDDISTALGRVLRGMPTAEAVERLRAEAVWCAPVNDLDAALADPAVRHLDPVLEFDHPEAGQVRVLKHPVRYSAGEPQLRHLPPGVGEHTEEVLGELGYSADSIAALRSSGAV
ncbi:MAG TPA: CaiB/BaiF CoA-transferase family protein [Candidatus Dormibacteraeota bacterium]|nr:CaiB/BaiF CoA-transferase family protein [Candidatus Dormibacteraeota bacterium]